MAQCSIDGCVQPTKRIIKGLCELHYHRTRRGLKGDALRAPPRPLNVPCKVDGCEKPQNARGLCPKHYKRWAAHGDPTVIKKRVYKKVTGTCLAEDCFRPIRTGGYCALHYHRHYRHGSVSDSVIKKRARVGDTKIDACGYVRIKLPDGRWRQHHRVIMDSIIGRPLLPHESVHHKNGDRSDNRPENLELWSKSQPAGQRVEDKLAWARELIALYEGTF